MGMGSKRRAGSQQKARAQLQVPAHRNLALGGGAVLDALGYTQGVPQGHQEWQGHGSIKARRDHKENPAHVAGGGGLVHRDRQRWREAERASAHPVQGQAWG